MRGRHASVDLVGERRKRGVMAKSWKHFSHTIRHVRYNPSSIVERNLGPVNKRSPTCELSETYALPVMQGKRPGSSRTTCQEYRWLIRVAKLRRSSKDKVRAGTLGVRRMVTDSEVGVGNVALPLPHTTALSSINHVLQPAPGSIPAVANLLPSSA